MTPNLKFEKESYGVAHYGFVVHFSVGALIVQQAKVFGRITKTWAFPTLEVINAAYCKDPNLGEPKILQLNLKPIKKR